MLLGCQLTNAFANIVLGKVLKSLEQIDTAKLASILIASRLVLHVCTPRYCKW